MVELKAMITKLASEVASMKLEHAEDRVFFKALNGSFNVLSAQVQNLDKQVEANYQKAEVQAKQPVTTEEAKKMSITEIGQLFKKDPAKAAEVMRQQGMDPAAGHGGLNPWIFNDRKEQALLEQIAPEKAAQLKAKAAMLRKVPTR